MNFQRQECCALVSVVMATYNGENYLRQQIDSILNQSYKNLEIIIVDDCSTDNTVSIAQSYADKDTRIRLYTFDQNVGFVRNFERGLRLAKGEFIVFSDQDDVFRKDKIKLSIDKLIEFPESDLVVTDLLLIDSMGKMIAPSMWKLTRLNPKSGKPFRRLVLSNFATGCAITIRRRLLNIALPFPENIIAHDWWISVVAAGQKAGGIQLIYEPLTLYRQHGSNVVGVEPLRLRNIVSVEYLARYIKDLYSVDRIFGITDFVALNKRRLNAYVSMNIFNQFEVKVIMQTEKYFNSFLYDDSASLVLIALRAMLRRCYVYIARLMD